MGRATPYYFPGTTIKIGAHTNNTGYRSNTLLHFVFSRKPPSAYHCRIPGDPSITATITITALYEYVCSFLFVCCCEKGKFFSFVIPGYCNSMNEPKGPVQVVTIAGTHRATFHAFGVTAWLYIHCCKHRHS